MSDPQFAFPSTSELARQALEAFAPPPTPAILYRACSDAALSFKAKGVLLALATANNTDSFSIELLMSMSSDQRTAVTSAVKELEAAGYLRRERVRHDDGAFGGYAYRLLV